MDHAEVERRRKRREQINEQIQEISKNLADLRKKMTTLQQELAYVDGYIDAAFKAMLDASRNQASHNRSESVSTREKVENPDRRLVTDIALKMIAREGRPLTRQEIFERLPSYNIEIKGKNPLMVLSTMLWRTDNMITRHPGLGYWPKGRPLPTKRPQEAEGPDLFEDKDES